MPKIVVIKYFLKELPPSLREIVGGYLQYDQIEELYKHLRINIPEKPIFDMTKNIEEEFKKFPNTEIIFLENYMGLKVSWVYYFQDVFFEILSRYNIRKTYLKCHRCNKYIDMEVEFEKAGKMCQITTYEITYYPKNKKIVGHLNVLDHDVHCNRVVCPCLSDMYRKTGKLVVVEQKERRYVDDGCNNPSTVFIEQRTNSPLD